MATYYSPCFNEPTSDKEGSGVRDSGGTIFPSTSVLSGLRLTGDFTIEWWMKPTLVQSGFTPLLMAKENSSGGGVKCYTIEFDGASGDNLTVGIRRSSQPSQQEQVEFSSVLDQDTWNHYALVCDISEAAATQFELFKNTTSVGNGSVLTDLGAPDIFPGNGDFRFPWTTGGSGSSFFKGYLLDIRVWNVKRTPAEIAANYSQFLSSPSTESNLKLNVYRGVDDDLTDYSAEGNDFSGYDGTTGDGADLTFVLDDPYDQFVIPVETPPPGVLLADSLYGRDVFFDVSNENGGNTKTSASGDWIIARGREVLRQALIRRIITNPGEWRTLPDYGVGARLFVKELNTKAARDVLKSRIRSQLLQDGRVESVESVNVEFIQDGLKIAVVVTPRGRVLGSGPLVANIEVV